ncbi:hypothetical protein V491_02051, partial [Pseudogymnoascus sp. VKM F-3775]
MDNSGPSIAMDLNVIKERRSKFYYQFCTPNCSTDCSRPHRYYTREGFLKHLDKNTAPPVPGRETDRMLSMTRIADYEFGTGYIAGMCMVCFEQGCARPHRTLTKEGYAIYLREIKGLESDEEVVRIVDKTFENGTGWYGDEEFTGEEEDDYEGSEYSTEVDDFPDMDLYDEILSLKIKWKEQYLLFNPRDVQALEPYIDLKEVRKVSNVEEIYGIMGWDDISWDQVREIAWPGLMQESQRPKKTLLPQESSSAPSHNQSCSRSPPQNPLETTINPSGEEYEKVRQHFIELWDIKKAGKSAVHIEDLQATMQIAWSVRVGAKGRDESMPWHNDFASSRPGISKSSGPEDPSSRSDDGEELGIDRSDASWEAYYKKLRTEYALTFLYGIKGEKREVIQRVAVVVREAWIKEAGEMAYDVKMPWDEIAYDPPREQGASEPGDNAVLWDKIQEQAKQPESESECPSVGEPPYPYYPAYRAPSPGPSLTSRSSLTTLPIRPICPPRVHTEDSPGPGEDEYERVRRRYFLGWERLSVGKSDEKINKLRVVIQANWEARVGPKGKDERMPWHRDFRSKPIRPLIPLPSPSLGPRILDVERIYEEHKLTFSKEWEDMTLGEDRKGGKDAAQLYALARLIQAAFVAVVGPRGENEDLPWTADLKRHKGKERGSTGLYERRKLRSQLQSKSTPIPRTSLDTDYGTRRAEYGLIFMNRVKGEDREEVERVARVFREAWVQEMGERAHDVRMPWDEVLANQKHGAVEEEVGGVEVEEEGREAKRRRREERKVPGWTRKRGGGGCEFHRGTANLTSPRTLQTKLSKSPTGHQFHLFTLRKPQSGVYTMKAPTAPLLRFLTGTTRPACGCVRVAPKRIQRLSTTAPVRAKAGKGNGVKKEKVVKPLPY